ncbi:MAG TPA: TIGR02300 family protein [Anaeromyxobacter sp.]|nr:TIGR02300 family protein [Anaeromyxobacter sp.]
MPAKDLGTKHVCFKCGTKFYDMRKPAPICPKCGADQRESTAVKGPPPAEKRARARPVEPQVEEAEVADADLDDDLEADEAEEEGEEADDEG